VLQSWLPAPPGASRPVIRPAVAPGRWRTCPFSALTPTTSDLRLLCGHFLLEKEFHGAHGLQITDAMALSIAVQACLPCCT
jgi:MtfA peptidase